jgi:hypothetical protein
MSPFFMNFQNTNKKLQLFSNWAGPLKLFLGLHFPFKNGSDKIAESFPFDDPFIKIRDQQKYARL